MSGTISTIDALMEGMTGPGFGADGARQPARVGRTAELIIGNGHGKYHEAVSRGKCFHASMQAGASLGTALTATAVTLTLYNPLNSGVLLALLHASVAITTVPGGAGTAVYVFGVNVNPLAAVPSATTPATVRNCLLGSRYNRPSRRHKRRRYIIRSTRCRKPFPATVVMMRVLASTRRTRLFTNSAIYRFPAESNVMEEGLFSLASRYYLGIRGRRGGLDRRRRWSPGGVPLPFGLATHYLAACAMLVCRRVAACH